jgi:hypothetical protein
LFFPILSYQLQIFSCSSAKFAIAPVFVSAAAEKGRGYLFHPRPIPVFLRFQHAKAIFLILTFLINISISLYSLFFLLRTMTSSVD